MRIVLWNKKSTVFSKFNSGCRLMMQVQDYSISRVFVKWTVRFIFFLLPRNYSRFKINSWNQLFVNLLAFTTFLSKKLTVHSVVENEFALTYVHRGKLLKNAITQKKIRENNALVTSLVKTLISRKKCWFFRKNRDRVL